MAPNLATSYPRWQKTIIKDKNNNPKTYIIL